MRPQQARTGGGTHTQVTLAKRERNMPILLNALHTDDATVSVDVTDDLQYWSSRLQASDMQIRLAIDAVGDSAPRVEAWLRESRGAGVVRQDGKWTFLQSAVRNLMFFATGLVGGSLLG